jgi:predicted secreted Zn-dependent protease
VKDINQLLKQIIPPADYQHRNGFSNENIISSLSPKEKIEAEQSLIKMLEKNDDDLIGETLTILKSKNSLPALRKRLEFAKNPSSRIIWASYINEINGGDEEMKNIALKEFEHVTEKYRLISTFHYLSRFQDSRINAMIKTFINDNDYLIAYNARTSIGIDTKEIIEKERVKKKSKWWQLWK